MIFKYSLYTWLLSLLAFSLVLGIRLSDNDLQDFFGITLLSFLIAGLLSLPAQLLSNWLLHYLSKRHRNANKTFFSWLFLTAFVLCFYPSLLQGRPGNFTKNFEIELLPAAAFLVTSIIRYLYFLTAFQSLHLLKEKVSVEDSSFPLIDQSTTS